MARCVVTAVNAVITAPTAIALKSSDFIYMIKKEIAVLGGGCFWCTEAAFKLVRGVISVMPGYAGGQKSNPKYAEIGSGVTGHAEVIQIEFDPKKVGFEDLLTVFFAVHDPTTLNRQGPDVGSQYRSIILYSTPTQKSSASKFMARLEKDQVFDRPIVTELKPLTKFYPAEDYHRDYYAQNEAAPYCQLVISPKLAKLREKFAALLKK